jgi:TM2 domain-containing membrane protein YozV
MDNSAPPVQTAQDQAAQQQAGLSKDARALMLYDANRKNVLVAYLLWFFLGLFGAHNFYLKRITVGLIQLVLTVTVVGSVVSFVWMLVDAFFIPGWVRNLNHALAVQLGA